MFLVLNKCSECIDRCKINVSVTCNDRFYSIGDQSRIMGEINYLSLKTGSEQGRSVLLFNY